MLISTGKELIDLHFILIGLCGKGKLSWELPCVSLYPKIKSPEPEKKHEQLWNQVHLNESDLNQSLVSPFTCWLLSDSTEPGEPAVYWGISVFVMLWLCWTAGVRGTHLTLLLCQHFGFSQVHVNVKWLQPICRYMWEFAGIHAWLYSVCVVGLEAFRFCPLSWFRLTPLKMSGGIYPSKFKVLCLSYKVFNYNWY